MAWQIVTDNIIVQAYPEGYATTYDPLQWVGNMSTDTKSVTGNYSKSPISYILEPADATSWVSVSFDDIMLPDGDATTSRALLYSINSNSSGKTRSCKIYLKNELGEVSDNYIQIIQNYQQIDTVVYKWFLFSPMYTVDPAAYIILFCTTNSYTKYVGTLTLVTSLPTDCLYSNGYISGTAGSYNTGISIRAGNTIYVCLKFVNGILVPSAQSTLTNITNTKIIATPGPTCNLLMPDILINTSNKKLTESTLSESSTEDIAIIIGLPTGSNVGGVAIVSFTQSAFMGTTIGNLSENQNNPTALYT